MNHHRLTLTIMIVLLIKFYLLGFFMIDNGLVGAVYFGIMVIMILCVFLYGKESGVLK